MKQDVQRSIGFHLWLSICVFSAVVTAATVVMYSWLTISDGVDRARTDAQSRLEALLASPARSMFNTPPTAEQQEAARSLGLELMDLIDTNGRVVASQTFDAVSLTGGAVDSDALSRALSGEIVGTDAQIDEGRFEPTSLSWLNLLRGGQFAKASYMPASRIVPGQSGVARVVISYPNLTQASRDYFQRAAMGSLMMLSLTMVATWYLLNHFVSRPLQRYSDLAQRIAQGEPTRMPAEGRDELSSLGRALNGMADALEHQATVDALTGLYNLRHLSSNLDAILAQAEATQTPVSLIVGDLDNLKPINDTYGHQAGDRLLRAVGAAVREWTGARNTCWRIGGDEFVIAMPGADAMDAMVKASEFRRIIHNLTLDFGNGDVRASISVGVATYPQDGDSTGALVGVADRRMYMTKTMLQAERALAAGTHAA